MAFQLNGLSNGDKAMALTAVVFFVVSTLVSSAVVNVLHPTNNPSAMMTAAQLWFVTAGVVGAFVARILAHRWFGLPGPVGWLQAGVGCIMVTTLAGIIGGTIALPIYGTMFGPMMVTVTLAADPLLTMSWFAALMSSHLSARVIRDERDCTFGRINRIINI